MSPPTQPEAGLPPVHHLAFQLLQTDLHTYIGMVRIALQQRASNQELNDLWTALHTVPGVAGVHWARFSRKVCYTSIELEPAGQTLRAFRQLQQLLRPAFAYSAIVRVESANPDVPSQSSRILLRLHTPSWPGLAHHLLTKVDRDDVASICTLPDGVTLACTLTNPGASRSSRQLRAIAEQLVIHCSIYCDGRLKVSMRR